MRKKQIIKNLLVALFWLGMTFGLVFLIFKFGLGAAVKISEFLQKRQPAESQGLTDNFLPEPKFFTVPNATNSAELPIQGYSLANKEVLLTLNDSEQLSFSVNAEGKFEGRIPLTLGKNNFTAVTKDFGGKESSPSKTYAIFFSNTPPPLEIIEPQPGSAIKNNPDIILKGKTDNTSKVYINDHLVIVAESGMFAYPFKLQKGENKFRIVCLDPAQNRSEYEITLTFRP